MLVNPKKYASKYKIIANMENVVYQHYIFLKNQRSANQIFPSKIIY